MRKKYEKLRDYYPEQISLGQLVEICKISKRSASYLVQQDIIPATDMGKKTWHYLIDLDEVIKYLRRREQWGSAIPCGLMNSSRKKKKERASFSSILTQENEKKLYSYFKSICTEYGDVITSQDAIAITGLSHKTVLLLLKENVIESIVCSPRYLIIKEHLLNFMTSERYLKTISCSEGYIQRVNEFQKWNAKKVGKVKKT